MSAFPKWMYCENVISTKHGLTVKLIINKYHPLFWIWLMREWIKK